MDHTMSTEENALIAYHRADLRGRMRAMITRIGVSDFLEIVAEVVGTERAEEIAQDLRKIVNHTRRLEAHYDGAFRTRK
jgi:hypothetical protein